MINTIIFLIDGLKMGHILLEGGAEFNGRIREADLEAMRLAGGVNQPIGIIPAAAWPDNNHLKAGRNAQQWFQRLGATHVQTVPLLDPASANDRAVAKALLNCQLIFLLGGFPHHLALTLADSMALKAIRKAFSKGAVIAGSSAGAMVLANIYFDPYRKTLQAGVGLLRGICIIPHYNSYGKHWLSKLKGFQISETIIGIDERTGLISDDSQRQWQVLGEGHVTVHHENKSERFGSNRLLTFGARLIS
jgi:cyanophycinase